MAALKKQEIFGQADQRFPVFKASLRIPPNNNILHVVCPVDIVCEGDAPGVSAVAGIRETVRARIHLHPRPTLLGN